MSNISETIEPLALWYRFSPAWLLGADVADKRTVAVHERILVKHQANNRLPRPNCSL